MSLVLPNVRTGAILEQILSGTLTLRLYSNDVSPAAGSSTATFTEVAGGGYADIDLDPGDWTVTVADPSTAEQPQQTFTFTGTTNSPGTIYGYFVVNADDELMWAERFDPSVLPFSPINGSTVKITPRITGASVA